MLSSSRISWALPARCACGLNGWASLTEGTPGEAWGSDMTPLFDTILSQVPAHEGDPAAPLQLQISSLDYSTFVGRNGRTPWSSSWAVSAWAASMPAR